MATFLHGTLNVWIKEAVNLPDTNAIQCFGAKKTHKSTVDAYVTMLIGGSRLCRTAVVSNNSSPIWDERFVVNVAHTTDDITFLVKDLWEFGEGYSNEVVGNASISAASVIPPEGGASGPIEGWFDIKSADNSTASEGSQLYVSIEYVPHSVSALADPVPNAYFDMSSDNDITLYQDAHADPNPIYEKIVLTNGKSYEPRPAWEEIAAAIEAANEFIYITDWSFAHEMRLIRTTPGGETVGEQLLRKADQGVRVLILLWKCRFATEAVDVHFVHDVITESYFSGTRVAVARVERDKCDNRSTLDNEKIKTFVSHHQKTVITDAPVEGAQYRKVIAFLGGLDITTGRWDTQQHKLFVAGHQEFENDFYQSSANVDSANDGPRMPWHDIYCRIDGTAALDVAKNFEERWARQNYQQINLIYQRAPEKFPADAYGKSGGEKWHAQILRSINVSSALFEMGRISRLTSKRGHLTEQSIYHAYVHLIRKAENFIYIENQFFNGSSFEWADEKRTEKSRHIIPLEIVYKIRAKILAGERFAAYIFIPMRPEGMSDESAVLDMQLNQRLTIKMMYKKISGYIKEAGIDAHATDYLNFFFLGNREPSGEEPGFFNIALSEAAKLRRSRRFMIYIHSKLMIVDDTYIILGSANINQRSMGGNRDSEIAMMAFQAAHKYSAGTLPRGQVHGFRMGLWAEHTGTVKDEFRTPNSLECVRAINEQAEANLIKYSQEKPCSLDGHIVKYPIAVDKEGILTTLPNLMHFPDSDTPIFGNRFHALPVILST